MERRRSQRNPEKILMILTNRHFARSKRVLNETMGTMRNHQFWILVLFTISLLTLNRNCRGEGVNIGLLGFRVHGGIERHGPYLIEDWCKKTGNQFHNLDTPDST